MSPFRMVVMAFLALLLPSMALGSSSAACPEQTAGSAVIASGEQLVNTTNSTAGMSKAFFVEITKGGLSMSSSLGALTMITGKSMSLVNGVECLCNGPLVQLNNLSQQLNWGAIPIIECDDINFAGQLLAMINSGDNPCTIMYSQHSEGCYFPTNPCNPADSQVGSVFTVLSSVSGQSILSLISNSTLTGLIRPTQSTLSSSNESSNSSGPTTTVATGILYGVTGIVAAAFLFIIVSGAIRVHKHPERYGLLPHTWEGDNSGFGSPNIGNTARAKGLARAVLDSIPLVRFQVAPTDGDSGSDIEKNTTADSDGSGKNTEETHTEEILPDEEDQDIGDASLGIKEANKKESKNTNGIGDHDDFDKDMPVTNGSEDDMCPICFEDLKDGDILRILPCKHKFHALCVDSWLLNSSSLCPLCRVDLSIAANEEVSETPPEQNATVPPGYDVSTSVFNRFLDAWNAQLLPREARRAALQRFHEEAELRRSLRTQEDSAYIEQNQRLWSRFVRHRRWLHARSASDGEETAAAQESGEQDTSELAETTPTVQLQDPPQVQEEHTGSGSRAT